MGQVHRLRPCRRCRHLFVAGPGEQLCPDCRRAAQRDRARRGLWGRAAGSRPWRPLAAFAAGSVGCSFLAGLAHPPWMGLAGFLGGAAALAYVARTTF